MAAWDGLTSKFHALGDAQGRPVALRLTAGLVADCAQADALTDTLGDGNIPVADKGHDTDAIRANARDRKAWASPPCPAGHSSSALCSRMSSIMWRTCWSAAW